MSRTFAPVFVTVYDRYSHLKRCIKSLEKCDLAKQTEIYISSDAPYKIEDERKIIKIREYIKSINGFKKIHTLFYDQNIGSQEALKKGREEIFKNHDRMIRLEDDVIVAPNFLSYMNDALSFYENNQRVISVSAFSYSIFYKVNNENHDKVYFTHRFNPWGFGIWREKKLKESVITPDQILDTIKNQNFIKRLDSTGIDLLPSIKYIATLNKALPNDYNYVYQMVINDLVTITPYVPKSFNIGNDGSGLRTRRKRKFVDFDLSFLNSPVSYEFTNDIDNNLHNEFSYKNYDKPFYRIKRILSLLGLLDFGMKLKRFIGFN